MEYMRIEDMVESQIIASVKSEADLDIALKSNVNIVFLLTGNLLSAEHYITRLKEAGKHVFLHLDFIDGLSNSRSTVNFIAEAWKPKGIITTKGSMVKFAKEMGLMTIQRIFLLDRSALYKGIEMVKSCSPDAVEIMPGILPKIVDRLTIELPYPIIAGGLVSELQEVHDALKAGALAVSSGNPAMWNYDL